MAPGLLCGKNATSDVTTVKDANERIAELEAKVAELEEISRLGGAGFSGESAEMKEGSLMGFLRKVNHVSRICADAEKSKEFYSDLLGATVLNRPNFPSPGYWLWLGNVQLHLIQGENASVEASHADGVATGNVNHISFETYDFDAVEAQCKALGVSYTKNLVPEGNDVIHQLFLSDPDGHYIEICDCDRFSDFVFGLTPDEAEAKKLAAEYLEGADLLGTTVAAIAALSFTPGETPGIDTQDEFDQSMTNLHRAFKLIAGPDGHIQVDEWTQFLNRMGHETTPEEVASIVAQYDQDASGTLDFPEFAKMMLPRMTPHQDLKKSFSIIDRDDDGKVTKDELLLMLWGTGKRMDQTQLAEAIESADSNGDGHIDLEEFISLVQDKFNCR
eukprot:CAMPEP_0198284110 /NCGR_PEP_ID=MMETSP1449-20131203/3616_1 /TAXON_ID=420275 /ORGANISM="Attheya septentrionalis, Strain CCMP2084" /LENGTH=387 /DNA_ID=CAMNT_0043981025 /DNA_START=18 /DNA_END=1181 /DNA_ORIENTATION=-